MTTVDSVSVVISVSERGDQLPALLESYYEQIANLGLEFEFIIVLPPEYEALTSSLSPESGELKNLRIVLLNRSYGEAGLLNIGINLAKFDYILTLPPYEQIEPASLGQVIEASAGFDAVVVNRWPRHDHKLNRIQSALFKMLLKLLAYNVPKDPGCGVRFSRREVFEEVNLYGDLHRFFFMLASQLGFRVLQLDIPQSQADAHRRIYGFRTYLSRLLDILTIGFLTRFNQKPLRFFGTGGAISSAIGAVGLTYIGIERIFFGVPAADRPLLVLFSLFLVLGVQLIAIGLVSETVIFTSAKENKEYRIRKIIN